MHVDVCEDFFKVPKAKLLLLPCKTSGESRCNYNKCSVHIAAHTLKPVARRELGNEHLVGCLVT
jgi:hypothetical protein